MSASELIEYIKKQRSKETHPLLIENKLLKAGWSANEIEKAYEDIKKEEGAKKKEGKIIQINRTPSKESQDKKEMRVAGFWIRSGAFLLDLFFIPIFVGIFFIFVSTIIFLFNQDNIFDTLEYWFIAGTFSYFVIFQWIFGGTIGQKIYGLQTIDEKTKEEINLGKALLSNVPYLLFILVVTQIIAFFLSKGWAYFLSFILFAIGSFMIGGKRKKGIHNRIAKTIVIRTPRKLRGPIFLSAIIFSFTIASITSAIMIDEYDGLPDDSAQSLSKLDEFLFDNEIDFPDLLDETREITSPRLITLEEERSESKTATEVYNEMAPTVVLINTDTSGGSGVLISSDGVIVTAYHVIDGADHVGIATYDDRRYNVEEVLDYSEEIDLAILKIDATDLPYAPVINPRKSIDPGSNAIVIGNPLGIRNSITQGIFTGIRELEGVRHVQFDSPISGGNSGGPVFNDKGELVGIAVFSYFSGEDLNFGVYIHEIFELDYQNLKFEEF